MSDKSENPVNLDVSAKVSLSGEASTHTIDRAVNALSDAVAPFTEGMGLIGDHIRAHRYDVAVKIAKKARALADERKLEIQPTPLKFTVPFLEKASLEDEETELADNWARLLLSAGTQYTPSQVTYIQILSEMTSNQAKLLQKIGKTFEVDDSNLYVPKLIKNFKGSVYEIIEGHRITPVLDGRALYGHKYIYDGYWQTDRSRLYKDETSALVTKLLDADLSIPVHVLQIAMEHATMNSDKTHAYARGVVSLSTDSVDAYLLQRQNLLQIEDFDVSTKYGEFHCYIGFLTTLGSEFYSACIA